MSEEAVRIADGAGGEVTVRRVTVALGAPDGVSVDRLHLARDGNSYVGIRVTAPANKPRGKRVNPPPKK